MWCRLTSGNFILYLVTGIHCAALQVVNSNSTGQDGKYKAVQQITCNTGFIIYSNKSNAYITECTESGLWSHVEDCHSKNILLCPLEKHLITGSLPYQNYAHTAIVHKGYTLLIGFCLLVYSTYCSC